MLVEEVGGKVFGWVKCEGRARMLRRGMWFRARSLILYLVDVILDSGLERYWRQERQRLPRFVHRTAAIGRTSEVNRAVGLAWNVFCAGESVLDQPSFLMRSIAAASEEGSWTWRPSRREAASRIWEGLSRLFFLDDEEYESSRREYEDGDAKLISWAEYMLDEFWAASCDL